MGFGNITAQGGFGSVGSSKSGADLTTVSGLAALGRKAGLTKEVNKITDTTPKLSTLQRISTGLGAFNPAEAILTGTEKGIVSGFGKYASGVVKGLGSALTGTAYEPERRTFKDVAEKLGVENSILKGGLGIVGDIFLDPSTYFGGAIAKGLVKGFSATTNVGLKALGKVAPEAEVGLKMAATGIKDAAGRLFKYGYGASKGAREDVLTHLSKISDAELGLAGSNMDRLGTNILTKEQQKELALNMVAKKRAEFELGELGTKTETIKKAMSGDQVAIDEISKTSPDLAKTITTKSSDPVVQKAIDDQLVRAEKMAKDIGIEDPYANYYPFIKKDKLEKFISDTQKNGIKVGSESYRKEFKNLLTNDQIELDPVKAFFTREAQIVTDKMNRNFLENFVKTYGKSKEIFKNADEAASSGYTMLKEKGLFGKELGYVSKNDASLLRDSLSPEYQSISMLARATGFDQLSSLFKRSVTGLFAPFHVRNFASGIIQNYEVLGPVALNPKLINAGQKFAYELAKGTKKLTGQTLEVSGKPTSLNKVYQAFKDRFGGATFYTNDFLDAVDAGKKLASAAPIISKEAVKETAKTFGLGQNAVPFKIARTIGQYIEHQQKATAYLGALSQGKSVKEALNLAEQAGFDYRALTRFESQIMRRIIPFYSFTRKNIALQLQTLGHSPQRINQIFSIIRNLGASPSDEEKQNLPNFISQALSIKIGISKNGLDQYIANFGTPIEAFANLFDDKQILRTISMMNPLLKVPVEIGIGKDSFRQKDLKDVYTATEYQDAPQIIKDLLMIHEVEKPISKMVGGKLVKVGTRKEYIADPERLLIARSLPTSRGVTYLDTMFNSKLDSFAKYLKLITGVRPYEVDIGVTKAIKERDMKRDLEDLLVKEGSLKKFERAYIPK